MVEVRSSYLVEKHYIDLENGFVDERGMRNRLKDSLQEVRIPNLQKILRSSRLACDFHFRRHLQRQHHHPWSPRLPVWRKSNLRRRRIPEQSSIRRRNECTSTKHRSDHWRILSLLRLLSIETWVAVSPPTDGTTSSSLPRSLSLLPWRLACSFNGAQGIRNLKNGGIFFFHFYYRPTVISVSYPWCSKASERNKNENGQDFRTPRNLQGEIPGGTHLNGRKEKMIWLKLKQQ